VFEFETGEEEIEIPLPEGVLEKNMRIPLIVCVNKCDLQSQVFRDDSTQKIMFVLYRLRKICIQCKIYFHKLDGAGLIYTSIKNNSNLNLLYEYTLNITYGFPFRFKT
jgi:dynein light intermediate chain 1